MTPEAYVTFWSLSLYDVHVPHEAYRSQISLLQQRVKDTQRGLGDGENDPEKRKKELNRNVQLIENLQGELKVHEEHVRETRKRLDARKDALLAGIDGDQKKQREVPQEPHTRRVAKCVPEGHERAHDGHRDLNVSRSEGGHDAHDDEHAAEQHDARIQVHEPLA